MIGRTYHRRYGYPWRWAIPAEIAWRVEQFSHRAYGWRKALERRGAAFVDERQPRRSPDALSGGCVAPMSAERGSVERRDRVRNAEVDGPPLSASSIAGDWCRECGIPTDLDPDPVIGPKCATHFRREGER